METYCVHIGGNLMGGGLGHLQLLLVFT